MRGEAEGAGLTVPAGRITPACAGRSRPLRRTRLSAQDHPRVCGEKSLEGLVILMEVGSPPRVRGEGCGKSKMPTGQRITPACAGRSFRVVRV